MIITKVTINNFKSFTTSNNVIQIEKDITTLIGKNESGKTNILEALSMVHFNMLKPQPFIDNTNKSVKEPISIIVELEFSSLDLQKFNISQSNTTFTFTKTEVTFSGGLSDLIKAKSLFLNEHNQWLTPENLQNINSKPKEIIKASITQLQSIDKQVVNYADKIKNIQKLFTTWRLCS